MLPQANPASIRSNVRFAEQPRNSYKWQDLRDHWPGRYGSLRLGGRDQIFFTKKFTMWIFLWKRKNRTMLPQANPASIRSNVRFACQRR